MCKETVIYRRLVSIYHHEFESLVDEIAQTTKLHAFHDVPEFSHGLLCSTQALSKISDTFNPLPHNTAF